MRAGATYTRRLSPTKSHFFLFGPRGTGKSTWLSQRFPEALVVDLLETDTVRHLEAAPERLRGLVAAVPPPGPVVIDEVQRIPQLLPEVHRLIELSTGHRFILTGSSARKLRRAGVDLLGGRAVHERMHPFLACELGDDFDLGRALELGMLPLVLDAADPERTLAGYAGLYLEQEVRAEGLVRNVGHFSRFLEAASFSHGGVLSVAAVARECAVPRKTVEGYVAILLDLLLAFRVPVFTRRAKRATVTRDKLYLFDAGVYRSLRPTGPLDTAGEVLGPAIEGLVAQHLRAWTDADRAGARLHYWRTRGGAEVDFVVYGPGTFVAVEVKSRRTVHRTDLRSLWTFHGDYPEATPVCLYGGRHAERLDGILCLPLERFLRRLEPGEALASALA